jgi:hypothetical protein
MRRLFAILFLLMMPLCGSSRATTLSQTASSLSCLSTLTTASPQAAAVDTPSYWSTKWRDSVAEYHYRRGAYRNEVLSYDQAFTYSLFPFAAELVYTHQLAKGSLFFFGRAAGLTLTTAGIIRISRVQGSTLGNVVLLFAGAAAYLFFKVTEIVDVQHDVSRINERLAKKWEMALSDVEPGSIRYPEGEWPSAVTQSPGPRHPESGREAIRVPVPTEGQFLQLNFGIPF